MKINGFSFIESLTSLLIIIVCLTIFLNSIFIIESLDRKTREVNIINSSFRDRVEKIKYLVYSEQKNLEVELALMNKDNSNLSFELIRDNDLLNIICFIDKLYLTKKINIKLVAP